MLRRLRYLLQQLTQTFGPSVTIYCARCGKDLMAFYPGLRWRQRLGIHGTLELRCLEPHPDYTEQILRGGRLP